MSKLQDKALCIAIKEAISDERAAPPMYEKLKEQLRKDGLLTKARELLIDKIIDQEKNHEKIFMDLAKSTGCRISTIEPERMLYADLPLKERIKIAREALTRMERL